MPWAKLDDNFHSHPKTYIVGLDGCGLFAKALSYAAYYLTDGFVPEDWVETQVPGTPRERDKLRIVPRLVESGMFDRVRGGYMIADYLVYNPSKAEVELDREKAKARRTSPARRPNVARTSPDVRPNATDEKGAKAA